MPTIMFLPSPSLPFSPSALSSEFPPCLCLEINGGAFSTSSHKMRYQHSSPFLYESIHLRTGLLIIDLLTWFAQKAILNLTMLVVRIIWLASIIWATAFNGPARHARRLSFQAPEITIYFIYVSTSPLNQSGDDLAILTIFLQGFNTPFTPPADNKLWE